MAVALLNDIGKQLLEQRRQTGPLMKPADFSLIFLGDPHVGYTPPPNNPGCSYNINYYKALLRAIDSTDSTLMAIFNGGDGANDGAHVDDFRNVTVTLMNGKSQKIPFFSGVGNHEYIHDFSLTAYKANISSKTNDVIHLYGNTFGPKVAVIMLNTGTSTDGSIPGSSGKLIIKESIDQIVQSQQYQSASKDPSVRFIIDMHIPPNIPVLRGDCSHVLCDPSICANCTRCTNSCINSSTSTQGYFHNFVQSVGAGKILAIVSHHKHGFIQPFVGSQYRYFGIPVFLTAQGGNCDPISSSDPEARLSYYKFYFHTDSPHSRDNYKLNGVNRIDVNPVTQKSLAPIPIY